MNHMLWPLKSPDLKLMGGCVKAGSHQHLNAKSIYSRRITWRKLTCKFALLTSSELTVSELVNSESFFSQVNYFCVSECLSSACFNQLLERPGSETTMFWLDIPNTLFRQLLTWCALVCANEKFYIGFADTNWCRGHRVTYVCCMR